MKLYFWYAQQHHIIFWRLSEIYFFIKIVALDTLFTLLSHGMLLCIKLAQSDSYILIFMVKFTFLLSLSMVRNSSLPSWSTSLLSWSVYASSIINSNHFYSSMYTTLKKSSDTRWIRWDNHHHNGKTYWGTVRNHMWSLILKKN